MPPARTFDAEAKVSALALVSNGTELAAGLHNGKVEIFSASGNRLRSCAAAEARVSAIAWSGDGRKIVVGHGKLFAMYDAATGARLSAWQADGKDIVVIACSRDGSLIASATGYEPMRLWKADGSPLKTLDSGPEVLGAAVSPSGDRVAEGSSDTRVRIFSAGSGALERLVEFPMACPVLAFSPDGRTLAAGSVDGAVSLIDVASGQSQGILGRHAIPAGAAAFSSDGKRLACAGLSLNPWGADAELKVWDLATRRESSVSIGPSFINTIGFAAGRPLAISARDQTVSVWEA